MGGAGVSGLAARKAILWVLNTTASPQWSLFFSIALVFSAAVVSLLPPNFDAAVQAARYGTLWERIAYWMGADRFFDSVLFTGVQSGLAFGLVACAGRQAYRLYSTSRYPYFKEDLAEFRDCAWRKTLRYGNTSGEWAAGGLAILLRAKGWRAGKIEGDHGRMLVTAEYGRWSRWGLVGLHLGLALVLTASAAGPWLRDVQSFVAVSYQTIELAKAGYPFDLRVQEIKTDKENFASRIKLIENGIEKSVPLLSAGQPVRYRGVAVYQAGGDWILNLLYRDAQGTEHLCSVWNGGWLDVPGSGGIKVTAAISKENPNLLTYRLVDPSGKVLSGAVSFGEPVRAGAESLVFTGQHPYVALVLKRDPTLPVAFLGGFLVIGGLACVWGVRRHRLWALVESDGGVATVHLGGDTAGDDDIFYAVIPANQAIEAVEIEMAKRKTG
ncbi:cytochrome c biogenesis protein ResB [Desulforudis sp. 1088]|uniref:cytochrome c biogenesis protein ResB n=1 Tax=unclassified Candidatus Desulforudis TaxID=2635950 RepID=UPI003CE541A9